MKKESDIAKSTTENHENKGFDFEASLNELEKLVDALENGDLSLEQSLHDFERGIHLTRTCQSALTDAQQKVQILLEKNGQSSLNDYEK
jgi:exodeoxyribonuclease VII small subunit